MEETTFENQEIFLKQIQNGFKSNNIVNIETGLLKSYEDFIKFILEDKRDDLINLGRDLSIIYSPIRMEDKSKKYKEITCLGEIKALINLCDYATQLKVPRQIWMKIGKSKYTGPIMRSLLNNGPMVATDLSTAIGLPHTSQLTKIVVPLLSEKVIYIEVLGKNTWYSLTATGRLMANKMFGADELQELNEVIPSIISKLRENWSSIDQLIELVDQSTSGISKYILVNILLLALKEAGVIEEKDNNWRINSIITKGILEWGKIKEGSIDPLLVEVTNSIKEKDFEKATNKILECRNVLNSANVTYIDMKFALDLTGAMAGILHGLRIKNNEIDYELKEALEKCKESLQPKGWDDLYKKMKKDIKKPEMIPVGTIEILSK